MNLALQKRHEQLERWKQNEADVESRQDCNSSIQINKFKKSASSPDIPFLTRRDKNNNNNNAISINQSVQGDRSDSQKETKRTNKLGRSKAELRVRFTNSTLFSTACANGDIEQCEKLLRENLVDINVVTSDGLTGLHEAAICGNAEMIEFLINHGANINCCDNEGWTPLHAAASLGQAKIVKLLLDFNADPTIVNCENFLAYDLSRNDEVRELIGKSLQDADIDYLRNQEEHQIQKDIEKWIQTGHYEERSHPATNATVLHVIAAKGYVKLLKQILGSPQLKKQINFEARDNEGYTPLLAASFWQQVEIVELLIENGANIFAQANNGYKISSIHLKNYQDSKLQQSSQLNSKQTLSSAQSAASLDSSDGDLSYGSAASLPSASARHLKQGHLAKSHSLELTRHENESISPTLTSSMSVDRLLLRAESMTDRELRKSFKDLVIENERLKRQLTSFDDRDKQKQQEWIRRERQLQRKISELEEENKELERWKQEIQRLKDENTSLIRVVSKLSKH